ncbi:MAG: 2-C-methyl-D-erythritol 4-phosphate cytidylyltransferase [Rickettsiales bacterium]
MHSIALIVAGGKGLRMSSDLPKQYLEISGKSILTSTIEKFTSHPQVAAVKVVIHPEHLELYQKATRGINLLPVSMGGERRQDSVFNGLKDLRQYQPHNVLIHDAARPFVNADIITNSIELLKSFAAVDVGVKPKDTIKRKGTFEIIDREQLYCTQTPQSFHFSKILELHQAHYNETFTDDIGLYLTESNHIGYVEGSYENIKITTPEDLYEISRRNRF